MKKILILTILISFLSLASPIYAKPENNLTSRLSGKILLDTSAKGEAWYVNPLDLHRYYLGKPSDALTIMKSLSLGISNDYFASLENSVPTKLWGKILLKPEDLGKAYYVNPENGEIFYLGKPSNAFYIMKNNSLGVSRSDLNLIPIANLNEGQNQTVQATISKNWQYLGWWGQINGSHIPVYKDATASSTLVGYFSTINRVKILSEVDGQSFQGNNRWYQIDGGQYPGAYINSQFITAIAQPIPESNPKIPSEVKPGEYWIDVNIGKQILTLFQYDQPLFATYVSTGRSYSPTVLGTYSVWVKLKKGGMSGGPPLVPYTYNLTDVPWIMYYKGSFAVHGTYWHDEFGQVRSAGCTNLTQGDAKYIFSLVSPATGPGNETRPNSNDLGTIVYNHY